MIDACTSAADSPLVRDLMGSVDCTTQNLLAGGYGVLAAPTGPVAAAITGILTLYIGFLGYRLMLGRGSLNVGEVAMIAIKIGLVFVLAGNWAVYQAVVCRVLFEAPAALAQLLVGSLQHAGSALSSNPFEALQQTFDELTRDVRSLASHAGDKSPLLGGLSFATMMLNADSYIIVFTSAGLLIATRVGLALLLALGPVVAGFLLFEATRGLVEGWLRAMIALALVSLTSVVLLQVELSMLEPILIQLATERAKDALTVETGMKATFVIAVFALATTGSILSAFLVSRGLRLPSFGGSAAQSAQQAAPIAQPAPRAADAILPRAAQVAAAAEQAARRNATNVRAAPAASIQASLAAGDRHRPANNNHAPTPDGAGIPTHRSARPRRELLVSRRKR
ncbi:type IV secretion system protein [Sphingomonas nostoxanthinifaciens]|uniref:type IV secretion system protein n=1 Tax=Sphingomonas nostoxanthinifaciens TaxID=2872652 RepID=UPI001CC1E450|nr:type IV secretion system protein [Sphingomonas nostoxanthinifaciens]UAK23256.1 type IV secretion system protein [Sphingomonas nostoxanthinifaciens]